MSQILSKDRIWRIFVLIFAIRFELMHRNLFVEKNVKMYAVITNNQVSRRFIRSFQTVETVGN